MKRKPATEHDSHVSLVKERIEQGTDWGIFRQIQINRAFYEGNQWISWDKNRRQTYVPPLKPGERRYTYNKIKPAILTLLSKLTKNRIQLEVLPDTNDDDRIEVARAGHKFIKWQYDKDKMDSKTRLLKLHMLIDGFPALKVFVDKSKGQEIPINALDNEVAEEFKGIQRTGEIITLLVDQTSLCIDPSAKTVDEIRWVVEKNPVDVDEINEKYGVEVQPEGNIEIKSNTTMDTTSDNSKKYTNHAMVNEYWEWPCAKYPNGRKITVVGDQRVDYTENPGENPYIFFPMIPVPGRAIADGVVKDMTTPQRSYNVKRTAEARILEEMGNPMWTIPEGSMEDEEEIVNEIGAILHYVSNGGKPERVPGIEPGGGWQNAMERDEADLEDISGAHEISQGGVPKGIDTYGGLQLLVEQDETKLAVAAHSFEEGMKQWGEKVLRYVQKFFPEERQLEIVGDNGEIDVFSFAGADLTGGEVVDVVQGSSMPEIKAVKEQKIFTMWDRGMFTNPQTGAPDTRRVMRMLGQSVASSYFEDAELDENMAKKENRVWEKTFSDPQAVQLIQQHQMKMQQYKMMAQMAQAQGMSFDQPPPQLPLKLPIVRDFYDHDIHIEVHNRFRKSDAYEQLPPELQAMIDQHVAEHEQAIQAPMLAQKQQQMAMQQEQSAAQAKQSEQQFQRNVMMKQMDHQFDMEREAIRRGK